MEINARALAWSIFEALKTDIAGRMDFEVAHCLVYPEYMSEEDLKAGTTKYGARLEHGSEPFVVIPINTSRFTLFSPDVRVGVLVDKEIDKENPTPFVTWVQTYLTMVRLERPITVVEDRVTVGRESIPRDQHVCTAPALIDLEPKMFVSMNNEYSDAASGDLSTVGMMQVLADFRIDNPHRPPIYLVGGPPRGGKFVEVAKLDMDGIPLLRVMREVGECDLSNGSLVKAIGGVTLVAGAAFMGSALFAPPTAGQTQTGRWAEMLSVSPPGEGILSMGPSGGVASAFQNSGVEALSYMLPVMYAMRSINQPVEWATASVMQLVSTLQTLPIKWSPVANTKCAAPWANVTDTSVPAVPTSLFGQLSAYLRGKGLI
jgi:hypothetical protein